MPDTSLPAPVATYPGTVYVDTYTECHYDPPYYYAAEWCDYWGDETYCTYYVGYNCFEEWVHDPYCGWSFVDDWCAHSY